MKFGFCYFVWEFIFDGWVKNIIVVREELGLCKVG